MHIWIILFERDASPSPHMMVLAKFRLAADMSCEVTQADSDHGLLEGWWAQG